MTTITQYTIGMSNVFILQGKKTILVDTGSCGGAEAFCSICKRQGIEPTDISLIIITHGHVDHYANGQVIKELTEAPVMVHKFAAETLRFAKRPKMIPRNEMGERIWAETKKRDPVPVVYPVEPDLVVEGEVDLHPYGVDAVMLPTPGHSKCSYSIFLDSGEVIVGDIILNSPIDNTVQISWFSDDIPALKKSVDMILERAEKIYSGHGGPFSNEEVRNLYEKEFGGVESKSEKIF